MGLAVVATTLVVCTLLQTLLAHPHYYTEIFSSDDCNSVPSKHFTYGHHKLLQDDTQTVLGIWTMEEAPKVVSSVCPGESYTVQVSFTEENREMFLTTTLGTFADGGSCPNRQVFDASTQNTAARNFNATLNVPCHAGDKTTFKLQAVSAADEDRSLQLTTASVVVDGSCAVAECKGAAAGAAPSPPPPSSPDRVPVTPQDQSKCSTTHKAGPKCTHSSLGYACAGRSIAPVTLHWSIGGCYPNNTCTANYLQRPGAPAPANGTYLHVAAEAATTGYVAMSFAKNAGDMHPAAAVLGWGEGMEGFAATYGITHMSVQPEDELPAAEDWAPYRAAVELNGRTIVCFSALLPDAAVPGAAGRRLRHSGMGSFPFNPSSLSKVDINWAVGGHDMLMVHEKAGGVKVDFLTGRVWTVGKDWVRVHAALMLVAWLVLLPLGVLTARHKWVFDDAKINDIHVWFHCHRAIQAVGGILFLTAIIIAWVHLNAPSTGLGSSHKVIGILIFIITVLQVAGTFVRPKPNHERRGEWNLVHWWGGRGLLVAAVVNSLLGALLWRSTAGEPLGGWLAAVLLLPTMWASIDFAANHPSVRNKVTGGRGKNDDLSATYVSLGTSGSSGRLAALT